LNKQTVISRGWLPDSSLTLAALGGKLHVKTPFGRLVLEARSGFLTCLLRHDKMLHSCQLRSIPATDCAELRAILPICMSTSAHWSYTLPLMFNSVPNEGRNDSSMASAPVPACRFLRSNTPETKTTLRNIRGAIQDGLDEEEKTAGVLR
jgi:hypothetical protein